MTILHFGLKILLFHCFTVYIFSTLLVSNILKSSFHAWFNWLNLIESRFWHNEIKPKEIISPWNRYFMLAIEVLDAHMHTELLYTTVNQSHYSYNTTHSWQLRSPKAVWLFIRGGVLIKQVLFEEVHFSLWSIHAWKKKWYLIQVCGCGWWTCHVTSSGGKAAPSGGWTGVEIPPSCPVQEML